MNKLTAKQLLMINRILTGNDDTASDELTQTLNEISDLPYEQDERFFYKYKDTVSKAAKLGCSIACIKPFEDKNYQSAILALLSLLELNNIKLARYEDDLEPLVMCLTTEDIEGTCRWIESYQVPGDVIEYEA